MKNAVRIYDVLLRFYPQSYQEAFGAQMRQTFIDHYRDVEESEGRVSVGFWFSTLTDEMQNIFRQHATALAEGNGFLKVTFWKSVVAAVFGLPLYIIFYLLLVKVSLALPHPHVSGISAILALAAVLLVFPGVLSLMVSYVLASTLIRVVSERRVRNV